MLFAELVELGSSSVITLEAIIFASSACHSMSSKPKSRFVLHSLGAVVDSFEIACCFLVYRQATEDADAAG